MSEENTQEAPKELREALDRANETLATETARADAAETNFRGLQATNTFEAAGLTAKHAELFLKTNPDAEVTAEAAGTFAKEYGLVPTEAPPGEPNTPDPNQGLAALGEASGTGTAGSTPAAQPKMSPEDFSKLLESNPQAAAAAYVDGTAPRNEQNVQARELVTKGIINH